MTKWTLGVVLCDAVLAVVINTSAMMLTGAPITFASWYPGVASAFFTNVLLQVVLPVPAAAQLLSRPLAGSKARFIASVFVENLVFVTCISFTMAVLQAGGRPVVDVWLQTYGQLVAIGYVTSVALWLVSNRAVFAKPSAAVSE